MFRTAARHRISMSHIKKYNSSMLELDFLHRHFNVECLYLIVRTNQKIIRMQTFPLTWPKNPFPSNSPLTKSHARNVHCDLACSLNDNVLARPDLVPGGVGLLSERRDNEAALSSHLKSRNSESERDEYVKTLHPWKITCFCLPFRPSWLPRSVLVFPFIQSIFGFVIFIATP